MSETQTEGFDVEAAGALLKDVFATWVQDLQLRMATLRVLPMEMVLGREAMQAREVSVCVSLAVESILLSSRHLFSDRALQHFCLFFVPRNGDRTFSSRVQQSV